MKPTATQKNTPKPTPPTLSRRKLFPALAFAFILIAAATALLLYKHHQTTQSDKAFQADKARFAQVEVDMAVVDKNIKEKFGNPVKSSNDKSCSRIALKYKQGDLWCGINYSYAFDNDITDKMGTIKDVLNGKNIKYVSQLKMSDDVIDTKLSSGNAESCSIEYTYGKATISLEFSEIGKYKYIIVLDCSNRMKRPIYPLAD